MPCSTIPLVCLLIVKHPSNNKAEKIKDEVIIFLIKEKKKTFSPIYSRFGANEMTRNSR